MEIKEDLYFNEVVVPEIDKNLHEDAYYEALATPLKSAKMLKLQERQQFMDILWMQGFKEEVEKSFSIIQNSLLPLIGQTAYDQVLHELSHIDENFVAFADKLEKSGEPTTSCVFQQLCGVSDETLLQIYDLALDRIKLYKYEEAVSLLTFLTMMAKDIPSYWQALGVCLQALNFHQDALGVYSVQKVIQKDNAAPYVYSAQCLLAMNFLDEAKAELIEAKKILDGDGKTHFHDYEYVKELFNQLCLLIS